jgi:hypothetical protein
VDQKKRKKTFPFYLTFGFFDVRQRCVTEGVLSVVTRINTACAWCERDAKILMKTATHPEDPSFTNSRHAVCLARIVVFMFTVDHFGLSIVSVAESFVGGLLVL